ncbi:MAG: hypothetical protein ABW275_07200, partial [Hansschlegelia sp.]
MNVAKPQMAAEASPAAPAPETTDVAELRRRLADSESELARMREAVARQDVEFGRLVAERTADLADANQRVAVEVAGRRVAQT